MADPLGSLEKIVKLALRIKEAVDTVRHNREECQQIRTRTVRVSSLLSRLPETGITGDPAMCDALGDLEDALRHAHALVTACQQSSTVCLYCTAGKQARRLRRVQDDISQKVMLVLFATNIHTTIILTNHIRSGDAPPPEQHVIVHRPVSALSPLPTCSPPPVPLPQALLPSGSDDTLELHLGLSLGGCKPPLDPPLGLREFSYFELEAATHQFSVQNMVGSGSFATVYKGVLHDGLLVAVKKFQHPNVPSARNINVLHLVSKLKHKNIVKLIGYSGEVHERDKWFEVGKVGTKEDKGTSYLLVEEYMPNGSLDKTINGLRLDWSSCFCLIQGIADGLCYLHERDVIHLDVKPSNILLDSDMNPKITDFGIAEVLNHKGVDFCSDIATIEGTLGYMPPEYITDGTLSKKHDVYGFGVTLLDTVSSMSMSKQSTGQASIEWAWQARQAGGGLVELLDSSLFETSQLKEIERCIEVGLLCTQFDPAERPNMLDALEMLRGEKALKTPVRPGYTIKEPANWLRRWGCVPLRL